VVLAANLGRAQVLVLRSRDDFFFRRINFFVRLEGGVDAFRDKNVRGANAPVRLGSGRRGDGNRGNTAPRVVGRLAQLSVVFAPHQQAFVLCFTFEKLCRWLARTPRIS